MLNFNLLLESTTTGNGGGMWGTVIMIAAVLLIFYFMIIRPQKKQEKQTRGMLDSLQVGDEITTIGGIIGKIISIKEETLMIETGHDRTKIRILKSAVRNVDVHAADAVLPNASTTETKKETK